MAHTVRICKDLTGWFATIGDDTPGYPGVRVHWEQTFLSPDDAMRILELAEALAHELRGERLLYWQPEPSPEVTTTRRVRPPLQVRAPSPRREVWIRRGRRLIRLA